MKLYTIGFKGKSAKQFFALLCDAGVQKVIDIRRSNSSQLAGFTKGRDLQFFLEECFGIAYEHVPDLAPSEGLLKDYRERLGKKKQDDEAWRMYVARFQEEMSERPVLDIFLRAAGGFDSVCLLCSEKTPERCHRRLVSERVSEGSHDIEVRHL